MVQFWVAASSAAWGWPNSQSDATIPKSFGFEAATPCETTNNVTRNLTYLNHALFLKPKRTPACPPRDRGATRASIGPAPALRENLSTTDARQSPPRLWRASPFEITLLFRYLRCADRSRGRRIAPLSAHVWRRLRSRRRDGTRKDGPVRTLRWQGRGCRSAHRQG